MNKYDLADKAVSDKWTKYYEEKGYFAATVNSKNGRGVKAVNDVIQKACKEKIERDRKRGILNRPIRAMIVGIPNVGKSSFINRLTGKSRAKVEDRPGVTRENQWFVTADGLELLDTPGVLWPKFEDQTVGEHLAFTGAIKDTILDTETLAVKLLQILKTNYPQLLQARYKITFTPDEDAYELLCKIGKRRSMVVRGGDIDTERAAVMLLDEYRGGVLGAMTLERPLPPQE